MIERSLSSWTRHYIIILAALLVLTVVTVVVAGINFGAPSINVIVALTIAATKGTLVALYFMHLRHDHPINAIVFATGLAILALFLIFCLIDVETRAPIEPANFKPPAGAAPQRTAP